MQMTSYNIQVRGSREGAGREQGGSREGAGTEQGERGGQDKDYRVHPTLLAIN